MAVRSRGANERSHETQIRSADHTTRRARWASCLVCGAEVRGLSAFNGFRGSSHHGVLCEGIPNGPLGGRESLFRNRYPCRREGSEKRTSCESMVKMLS